MRVMLGALLGFVVGSVLVGALGVAFDAYAYLAVLAGGVLAGVAMRAVAGSGGGMYARGAMAALAAGLAAVAGPLVATQWFQSQASAKPLVPKVVAAEGADEKEAADTGEAVELAPVEAVEIAPVGATGRLRAPERNPFAVTDVVCLVIGCLAAYQIGKGPEPMAVSDEDGEDEGQPAPDTSVPPSD